VCQAFPGQNPGILIAGTSQAPNFAAGTGLQVTPGTTFDFQVFYRDLTLPGGAGFNLTDAVAIPLTP